MKKVILIIAVIGLFVSPLYIYGQTVNQPLNIMGR